MPNKVKIRYWSPEDCGTRYGHVSLEIEISSRENIYVSFVPPERGTEERQEGRFIQGYREDCILMGSACSDEATLEHLDVLAMAEVWDQAKEQEGFYQYAVRSACSTGNFCDTILVSNKLAHEFGNRTSNCVMFVYKMLVAGRIDKIDSLFPRMNPGAFGCVLLLSFVLATCLAIFGAKSGNSAALYASLPFMLIFLAALLRCALTWVGRTCCLRIGTTVTPKGIFDLCKRAEAYEKNCCECCVPDYDSEDENGILDAAGTYTP